jgi:membrane protease YdiL (CAAX protease family)
VGAEDSKPRVIPAVALIHQEGVVAVVALVGLWLSADGISGGLAAKGPLPTATLTGILAGVGSFLALWLIRGLRPLRELERWQLQMVRGWTVTDAAAVALFSGLAEEALVRALLQPLIGLLPAAAVFAVLHLVPDRRLWVWPILALVLGLVLGGVYELGGFPAAAAAHVAINALSLLRLRRLCDD